MPKIAKSKNVTTRVLRSGVGTVVKEVQAIVEKIDSFVQCYICSGPGHTARNCSTLFRYLDNVKPLGEVHEKALSELIDKRFEIGREKRRKAGKFF